MLVDVGQVFDLDASIVRGRAAGAEDVIVLDRKEAFADEQVARALKTNALYEGRYPLVSALSRPVIAEAVADVAERAPRRSRRARLHRKGQRPAPLRARLPREVPRRDGDRPPPRQGLDTGRGNRVRAGTRDPHQAIGGVAVLDRREPLRPFDRVRRARGSVGGASRRAVRADERSGARRRPRGDRRRVRARAARRARRRGAALHELVGELNEPAQARTESDAST